MVDAPVGLPPPTVSLCVICHDRPGELIATLESASTEAWHEILVLDMASEPPLGPIRGATVFRSATNIGPAAGRNRLAERASGELLVFLDDDVVLRTPVLGRVRELFATNPRLTIVAFKVHREGGVIESKEYPFRGAVANEDNARPCAYFVSAGYACRKMSVEAVGGYEEAMFIYCEELELSFSVLAKGGTLWYEPSIAVEHRPSANGRSAVIPANTVRNRILIVRRYLPPVVQPVHLTVWFVITAVQAKRAKAMRAWASSFIAGWRLPVSRRVIPWRQLIRIHRMGGRVFY